MPEADVVFLDEIWKAVPPYFPSDKSETSTEATNADVKVMRLDYAL